MFTRVSRTNHLSNILILILIWVYIPMLSLKKLIQTHKHLNLQKIIYHQIIYNLMLLKIRIHYF